MHRAVFMLCILLRAKFISILPFNSPINHTRQVLWTNKLRNKVICEPCPESHNLSVTELGLTSQVKPVAQCREPLHPCVPQSIF